MHREACGILVSRQEDIVGYRNDNYSAACIMPNGHIGPHVIKTPEGRYFSWEYENDCGCCEPDDPSRCYDHRELMRHQVLKLIEEES